jgi:hypothetical protein
MATEVLALSLVETLLDYLGNPDDGNVYRLEQADPIRKHLREEAEKLQAQLAATVARFDAHLARIAPDPDVPHMYVSAGWGHD